MALKTELSRITIEIPKTEHKKLKARAAIMGKSMKDVILDMIKISEFCVESSHIPNKETVKSIKNIESGKNITEIKSLEALAKKFGL